MKTFFISQSFKGELHFGSVDRDISHLDKVGVLDWEASGATLYPDVQSWVDAIKGVPSTDEFRVITLQAYD